MQFGYTAFIVCWATAAFLLLYAGAWSAVNPSFHDCTAAAMVSKSLLDVLTADAAHLQSMLQKGNINSSSLIDVYLAQISKHDHCLHAMIQLTPLPLLKSTAEALDLERKEGIIRGPLHGIPILIKDNIASHPRLGLRTTAGSLALFDSKPPRNAKIVDLLIKSGAIILGKTNLSVSWAILKHGHVLIT